MNYEKVRAAVKVECDRQQVGEDRQKMLFDAYGIWGVNHPHGEMTEYRLKNMAGLIEPDNLGMYRMFPVTFKGGVYNSVFPNNIPQAMVRWIEWFNQAMASDEIYPVDNIIKEFLDIHPFSDGNGRTAWLLRVWMLNQWDDPQPLPNYYGE